MLRPPRTHVSGPDCLAPLRYRGLDYSEREAMLVDTGLLRSGARESHHAGGHAHDGVSRLARGPQVPTMFGDFAAAEAFHDAVTCCLISRCARSLIR
ncbi:DUF2563 family protein [Mycobacterium riyadhense]|uniref:DUF2563 family protein n=1 Tax=Mycobacterium riyadhense TaxID=486698 RepID=UPI003B9679C5